MDDEAGLEDERMDVISDSEEDAFGAIPLTTLMCPRQPGLFVSEWDETLEDGVGPKDLDDPREQA